MRFGWQLMASFSLLVSCGGGFDAEPPTAPSVATKHSSDGRRPFDRAAAANALSSVDVQRCKVSGAPPGSGHVTVTFSPEGNVDSVAVDDGPFTGGDESCIVSAFSQARVPPFDGARIQVGKSFTIDERETDGSRAEPFDRGAAAKALGSVDIRTCKTKDGPTGAGHVTITFANDGHAISANIDDRSFAGTLPGDCIASRFMNARVPAFAGPAVRVGKSFTL